MQMYCAGDYKTAFKILLHVHDIPNFDNDPTYAPLLQFHSPVCILNVFVCFVDLGRIR
jgi:hypothetical protein